MTDWDYYANLLPDEIVDAISILNRGNLAILLYLCDKEKSTISEIAEFMNTTPDNAYETIEALQECGLVVNKIKKDEGKPPESFFKISAFGEIILQMIEMTMRNLINLMNKRNNMQR